MGAARTVRLGFFMQRLRLRRVTLEAGPWVTRRQLVLNKKSKHTVWLLKASMICRMSVIRWLNTPSHRVWKTVKWMLAQR